MPPRLKLRHGAHPLKTRADALRTLRSSSRSLGATRTLPRQGFKATPVTTVFSTQSGFILIEASAFPASGDTIENVRTICLYDAVERRSYGEYVWTSSK